MKKEHALAVVAINELALDKECVALPTQFINACFNAAEARMELASAEQKLEVAESNLAKRVRDVPGQYGLEKVTEAAIKEIVRTHASLAPAQLAVSDARHELELCGALVSALDHKKRALTNLVELHKAGYNGSSPVKASREQREQLSEEQQRETKTRRRME